MNSVTAVELGEKLVELLGLKPGEPFDIAKTSDGQVLVRKAEVEPVILPRNVEEEVMKLEFPASWRERKEQILREHERIET